MQDILRIESKLFHLFYKKATYFCILINKKMKSPLKLVILVTAEQ